MFKKFATVATVLFFSVYFTACKKESSTKVEEPQAPVITGKWRYLTSLRKQYSGGQTKDSTYIFVGGEYVQFNTDGTGIGNYTTFNYKVDGKKLTFVVDAYFADGTPAPKQTVTCEVQDAGANKLIFYYDYTEKLADGTKTGHEIYDYLSR
ncbi:hypothetical protein FPZ43_10900 [Mucilaginibacter pallidiroseus]|uniref:Lipocalin-like domain-containing protein n=1 Tax=Mucilaginibacter pallidiroseus TaxID=2599295 RepID=A0A563UDN8_9SPHI|nr:hypothetical protein [Mucilaginibacter pallidiroseus]TWR29450.1 hypothetical protein FPZ43_10900 [Mucilaginibacter pallidiroseus]